MNLAEWTKNPDDISAGLNLFRENITNAALFKVLSKRDSPAVRARLYKEICAVAGVKAIQENEQLQKQIDSITELSPELKELEKHRIRLYKESEHLKFELNICEKKERRCTIAHQILKNFNDINEIWAKIDYFQKNKCMPGPDPDPEEITETDPVQLHKMLMNVRANISKAKNKPDKVKKLNMWEKQREQIEKKLENKK
jgi:hypothetical protein